MFVFLTCSLEDIVPLFARSDMLEILDSIITVMEYVAHSCINQTDA